VPFDCFRLPCHPLPVSTSRYRFGGASAPWRTVRSAIPECPICGGREPHQSLLRELRTHAAQRASSLQRRRRSATCPCFRAAARPIQFAPTVISNASFSMLQGHVRMLELRCWLKGCRLVILPSARYHSGLYSMTIGGSARLRLMDSRLSLHAYASCGAACSVRSDSGLFASNQVTALGTSAGSSTRPRSPVEMFERHHVRCGVPCAGALVGRGCGRSSTPSSRRPVGPRERQSPHHRAGRDPSQQISTPKSAHSWHPRCRDAGVDLLQAPATRLSRRLTAMESCRAGLKAIVACL